MLQFLSNNLNPIFVKEIRQFVRSNFIVFLIHLYIFFLVSMFLSFLINVETTGNRIVVLDWWVLGNVIVWTCFFSVVVRTVWSTSVERINDDLMFYSSMKPSTIVLGKLLTGVVITFVLMSITMPFVVLLNLMGGMDLFVVLLVLVEIFVLVQVMNALAILIASTSKLPFANFLSLIAISFVFVVLNMLSYNVVEEWDRMGTLADILKEFIALLISEFLAFALIVCVTIAKFSPQKSNRLFHVRLVVTIIFVTVIVCTLSEIFLSPLIEVLFYVELTCFMALMFLIAMVVCERDQWTPRIRQGLPKSLILRFILFPFYTGSACGLVWIGLMLGLLVWVDLVVHFPMTTSTLSNNGGSLFRLISSDFFPYIDFRTVVPLFIFFFNVCVTAMLIRSWWWKQIDTSKVWLIMFPIVAIVTLGSIFVYAVFCLIFDSFTFEDTINPSSRFMAQYCDSWISGINPYAVCDTPLMDSKVSLYKCSGMIGWTVLLLPFLIIWYRQRLKTFSPYNIEEPISYEEAKEAAENPTDTDPANQKLFY